MDNYISPYHNLPDPSKQLAEILNEVGLEPLTCESRPKVFIFPNETILTSESGLNNHYNKTIYEIICFAKKHVIWDLFGKYPATVLFLEK